MSIRLAKDIGTIRSALFERIENVQTEYAARGWLPARLNLNKGIARGMIELFAWGLWQLYNFLDVIHKQAIPLESTGEWLDLHAAQVNEQRKAATKAKVRPSGAVPLRRNLPISRLCCRASRRCMTSHRLRTCRSMSARRRPSIRFAASFPAPMRRLPRRCISAGSSGSTAASP